ncbi:MAG TPA: hypothetical protein VIL00_06980 [Pseudonocardiaceae bacterium]|mgnify:CR=1 FL=1
MIEQHDERSSETRSWRWGRGVALGLLTVFLVAGCGARVTTPAATDGGAGAALAAGGSADAASASAAPVTTYPTRPDGPPADRVRRAKELTTVFREADLLPEGMRMEADPVWDENDLIEGRSMEFNPMPTHPELPDGYWLRTNLRDDQGVGGLSLSIQRMGPRTTARNCAEIRKEGALDCTERTGPHGERLVLSTGEEPFGARVLRVDAYRSDGTWISIGVRNLVDSHQGKPTRPTPPLDHDQLIRIVTLPELQL